MSRFNPSLVIGIHGTRQSGKDLLASHFCDLDYRIESYAFAAALKDDLEPFVREHFGFGIWSCTPAQKELVRPLLIAYGCAQREVDIDHWVKKVVNHIHDDVEWNQLETAVITDVRFVSEAVRLRSEFGNTFKLVDLQREGAPEPTEEEKKHYLHVREMADIRLKWGNDSVGQQRAKAARVLEQVGVKIPVE